MRRMSATNLDQLLTDAGLAEKVVKVDNNLVRMQWGSAFVLVGVSGSAVVAIAPLFKKVPAGKEQAFYEKLLQHNAFMGGMASFALQADGWVVLQSARAIKGIDATEFGTMVAAVGRFADDFDDKLIAEFYAEQPDSTNQAPAT
jgi:hypothetical protein